MNPTTREEFIEDYIEQLNQLDFDAMDAHEALFDCEECPSEHEYQEKVIDEIEKKYSDICKKLQSLRKIKNVKV